MRIPEFRTQCSSQFHPGADRRFAEIGKEVSVHCILDLVDVAKLLADLELHIVDARHAVERVSQAQGLASFALPPAIELEWPISTAN